MRSSKPLYRPDENSFSVLFNFIDDAVFILEFDGRIIQMNSSACRRLGYEPYELTHLSQIDRAVPADPSECTAVLKQIMKTGGRVEFESTHRLKSGSSIPVEICAQTILSEGREVIVSMARDISKRRQLETEQKRFFEMTSDFIGTAGFDGKFIMISPSMTKSLGYSREELCSMPFSDIIHPDDREKTAEAMSVLAQGKEVQDFENRYIDKDGAVHWLSWRSTSDISEQKIFFAARDVTEKHLMEDAVKTLNERLVFAKKAGLIGIWDWIIESDHLIWDDEMYLLYNLKKEEFGGKLKEWIKCIDPLDAAAAEEMISEALSGRSEFSVRFRTVWSDGSVHHLKADAAVLRNDAGEAVRMVGVNYDITVQQETELKLRRSEQQYQTLFEQAPDPFLIIENGVFSDCNASALKQLGARRDQVAGQSPDKLSPERQPDGRYSAEKAAEKIRDAVSGIPQRFEWLHHRIDGSTFWADVSLAKISESEDRILVSWRDITEQKKIREELLASEKRLSLTLDAAGEGIWDWDVSAGTVQHNHRWCEILGLDDNLLTHSLDFFGSCLHPDDRDLVMARIADGMAPGKRYESEHRMVRRDGSVLWAQDRGAVVTWSESGEPLRMVGSIADITERKKIEEALRDGERVLQESQAIAGLGSYILDIQAGTWSGSPVLDEIFGIEADFDHSVAGWTRIIHEDYRKNMEYYFTEIVLGSRSVFDREYQIVRPRSGEVRWVHGLGRVELNSRGEPARMMGTIMDITARKAAESALREREERYRLLTEFASDVIWVLNLSQKRFTYISPSVYYLRGITAEEALAESLEEAIMPDFQELVRSQIEQNLSVFLNKPYHHEYYTTELQQPCADGSVVWVEVVTQFRFSGVGEIEVVGVSRNIDNRKKMEQSLIDAKNAADEANRAKSEFLANMSHEIRTPLNAVIGFSELLSTEAADPRQKSYLTTIRNSGKTLLQLINDILDLSKIDAGKMKIEKESADVYSLMYEISALFQLTAEQKQIGISLSIEEAVPAGIIADEGHLRQILVNIIGNAVKFTDRGGVSIAVSAEFTGETDILLTVAVSDTGIGIPEDQREVIFEDFRQQDGQSRRKFGGTGLGLAISQKLIKLMGGSISVESREGEGTCFTITIPAEISYLKNREDRFRWEDVRFSGESILVVDDIESNRSYLNEVLSRCCLNPVLADSGESALSYCRLNALPSLVLLDIRMPGMDGFETLDALREIDGMDTVPILALTASTPQADETDMTARGFSEFLAKPIEPTRLFQSISRYLTETAAAPVLIRTEESVVTVLHESELDEAQRISALLTAAVSPLQFGELETAADLLLQSATIPELTDFGQHLKKSIDAMDILDLIESPLRLSQIIQNLRGRMTSDGGSDERA